MSPRFNPANQCIYCGAVDELSDEHIVPYGLGGDLVFPRASCQCCATKTSLFELRTMRGFMNDSRLVSGLPSRRKKRRPNTKHHELQDSGDRSKIVNLPLSESIGFLHLPTMEAGAFMSDKPPVTGARVTGIETIKFGRDVRECLRFHDATGIKDRAQVDVHSFTKMLAKIAYSFLVAKRGVFPRNESPALAIAMAQSTNPSNWIGSQFMPPPTVNFPGLHALAIEDSAQPSNGPVTVVKVALFRSSGACTYEVVARAPGWQAYEARLSDA